MKTVRFCVFTIVVVLAIVSGTSTYANTGHIAYVSDRNGQNEIYLMEMDGSNQTRLTDSPYDDTTPVFSPDGQRIAFFSNRSGSYRIYTMNWDGTGTQEIPNCECSTGSWNAGRGLAWSPDGQKVLFKPTDSSLAAINLDGSEKNVIWDGPINGHGYIQGVEWGPTMNDIYVNAQNPGWGYDQHVFRKSDGGWAQITDDSQPFHSMAPKASSGISRIVFIRGEGWEGPVHIYMMGLNGEDMVKLTFGTDYPIQYWAPDWMADGDGIVFCYGFDTGASWGPFHIGVMDSTGANLQILPGDGSNFAPSWTPVRQTVSEATIDIDPNTLDLKSTGKWITCYIELGEDYDVADIDVSTVMLNEQVPAELRPTEIGDYDDDGVADLMVKFDRSAVQEIVEVGDAAEITVTGELIDGTPFEGRDTIRVINPGGK